MKAPILGLVEIAVARAGPVAIGVDEHVLKREEFECTIDIEQRRKRGLKLIRLRLVEHAAELDQRVPRLGRVLGFDFVD